MKLGLIAKWAFVVVIGMLLCWPAAAQNAAPQKNDYQAMVDKVKGGFLVDFGAMREAYTKTEDFSGYGDGGRKEMSAALGAKKFKEALALAEKRLDEDFVDLNAHYVAFVASHELGNKEKEKISTARFL
jgi:hypothetical protein